jgi:hypothetical protein
MAQKCWNHTILRPTSPDFLKFSLLMTRRPQNPLKAFSGF